LAGDFYPLGDNLLDPLIVVAFEITMACTL